MVSLKQLLSLHASHPRLTSTVFSLGDKNVVVVKHKQLERFILDSTVQMICEDWEPGGVLINVMTFSKKLIHSKVVNTVEGLKMVLTEFQKIDCKVCEGFQPEDIDQVDLNSILIEKYNDQLLYRSKNCLYISQLSDSPHCCSNCQFLKQTSSDKSGAIPLVSSSLELLQTPDHDFIPIIGEEGSPGLRPAEQEGNTVRSHVIVLDSSTSWPVHWTGDSSTGTKTSSSDDNTTVKTVAKKKTRGRPIVYDHPCNAIQCNEIFSNLTDLKKHKKSRHSDLFKCSWPNSSCSKSFVAQKDLDEHLLSHSSERPFKCETCGKGFTSKKVFKEHLKLHFNIKLHICETCNKSFARKDSLEVHQSVHTKERPFLCLKCGKSFTRQSHLTEHDKRTHLEIRRYLCLTCNKTFFTSQQLSRHSRVHSRERPYHCTKCDKTFARDHHLKIHKQRFHEA